MYTSRTLTTLESYVNTVVTVMSTPHTPHECGRCHRTVPRVCVCLTAPSPPLQVGVHTRDRFTIPHRHPLTYGRFVGPPPKSPIPSHSHTRLPLTVPVRRHRLSVRVRRPPLDVTSGGPSWGQPVDSDMTFVYVGLTPRSCPVVCPPTSLTRPG